MDEIMRSVENKMEYAEAAVIELRDNLLNEGISANLVVFAFFHHGVAMTAAKLDDEDSQRLLNALELFMNDTKEIIRKYQN